MCVKQSQRVQEYISSVCLHIKNRKVHEEINAELTGHIEEIVSEHLSAGVAENEAVEKAISRMGDAALVGRQLDKIHRLQPEWSILIITTIFTFIGLLAMYLIESKGALLYNNQLFNKSLFSTLLGIAAAFGLYFFDYRKIQAYSKYIYIGTLLVLLFVIHMGTQINGAKAWLNIGPFNVNFVSITPFLFIIALAGLFDNWDWNKSKNVLYGLILCIIPAILMIASPSFSAFATYCVAVLVLMVMSGIKLKHILFIIGSGSGLLLLTAHPYRMKRLLIFLNPHKDPQGVGWINIQLNRATHAAGLFGQGFNFSPGTIPEVHTDFIFTYIVYTFGWLAGIVLAALIVAFLVRVTRTAMVTKNSYGKLLVSGFTAIFSVQFIWNILMNLSLAPISGVGLPFISFGGSQFVISMAAIGIVSNVYRWRNAGKVLRQT